ncbi:phosphatase PAP2 family protein [Xylanibacter muris]|uniref:phosphatase PAP2 family protein n=1 Tax=Xylanibacter muris TaxID=2736290 RepID=UPI001C1312EB|nr:phosphatase PAP2 family protein [Xylanibacter muris]
MIDIDSLIQFDKQLLLAVNGSDSLFLDGVAKVLTTASTWFPMYAALFYLILKNNENFKKIMLIIACAIACVILAGTVDDTLVKPFVARPRPTHDPQIGLMIDIVNGYRGGRYGFFSAHAANTFSAALFFCLLVRNRILSTVLIIWSLTNCWTRMYLGVHYPGDILCGLIWGGIVALTVYTIYLKINRKLDTGMNFVSSQYTKTGYQQSDVDVVITVFAFSVIYSIIRGCLIVL